MLKQVLHKALKAIVLALLSAVPLLVILLAETPITQNMGILSFRTLRIVAAVLAGMGVLGAIIYIIVKAVKARREQNEKKRTEQQIEELKLAKEREERNAKAKLNVREPLKDTVICDRLKSWLNEDWGRLTAAGIPGCINDILGQMDEMNGYQAKLSRLLTNNGADYLEDTNSVLESVEQCILRKVRKVLNCFVVYDATRTEDIEKMRALLGDTRASNAAQLENVKEFLFAITDFLNKQGDDNTGMEKLAVYKKTILESTDDAE